jgi:hypothetical protein
MDVKEEGSLASAQDFLCVCVCVCFYLTSGGTEAHDPGPGGAHRTIGRQKAIRASWSV